MCDLLKILPKEKECEECGGIEFEYSWEGKAICRRCGNDNLDWEDIGFNKCLSIIKKNAGLSEGRKTEAPCVKLGKLKYL